MKSFIASIFWLSIAGMVAYGIYAPQSGFVSVAAMAIWATSIVAIVMSVVLVVGAYYVRDSGKADAIEKLRKALAPKSKPVRVFDWIKFISLTALCAYTGMIATGGVYLAAGILSSVMMYIARTLIEDPVDSDSPLPRHQS